MSCLNMISIVTRIDDACQCVAGGVAPLYPGLHLHATCILYMLFGGFQPVVYAVLYVNKHQFVVKWGRQLV